MIHPALPGRRRRFWQAGIRRIIMKENRVMTSPSVTTDVDSGSFVTYWTNQRKEPLTTLRNRPSGPAVTISDQTGAGAHEISNRLAALLQAREPEDAPRWAVYDRLLVEEMLKEHHLPN